MARPKAFDSDVVLDQVMHTFWSRGYANTSISDLESSTGLGRQSLYGAFGDKHALFLEALRRYARGSRSSTMALLDQAGAGLSALREFMVGTVDFLSGNGSASCFMVKSLLEVGGSDPEVRSTCTGNAAQIMGTVATVLSLADQRGDLRPGINVPATARLITAQLFGLSVLMQGGASRDELLASIDAQLAQLRR